MMRRVLAALLLMGVSLEAQVSFDRLLRSDGEPQNWLMYSGTFKGHRYTELKQITPENVRNLEPQWVFQARSLEKFEATPLVVDGVLYTVQPPNDIVALDAHTGRIYWAYSYRPSPQARLCCGRVNRGLAILGDSLFMGTIDGHLVAVNAKSGRLIWDAALARPEAGYSLTLRILDTHIRTVEPTAFGWIVCLICYQPFYSVTFSYLAFSDRARWQAALPEGYLLQSLWGFAILFCLFIYAWSTVCFGLRFSNLTHRGIITSGPYRWMKHPAYVSKNVSWWLISVPFLDQASYAEAIRYSILLLLVNGIYLLRAMTEERHLSWDRDYVAYKDFIRREGLWARILNLFGRRPAASGGL